MDGRCFETFLKHLGEEHPDHHSVVVLDNAPSHRSEEIDHPENVSLLALPAYSPELNPVEREREREMVSRIQACFVQPEFRECRATTRSAYENARALLGGHRSLTTPRWLFVVGGSHRHVMTSSTLNGITVPDDLMEPFAPVVERLANG